MTDELRKLIPLPHLARFKQLWEGLEVDQVLGDRVLVQEVEPLTDMDRATTESGIVIPDDVRKRNTPEGCTGIVHQVGMDATCDKLAEGKMVMFGQFAGEKYSIGKVKFRVLDTSEVLCTLKATEGKVLGEIVGPVKDEAA